MFRLTALTALLLTTTACIFPQPCGGGRNNDLTCDNPANNVSEGDYLARECSESPCLEADVDVLEDVVEMIVTDDDGNTWLVTWPREGLTPAGWQ